MLCSYNQAATVHVRYVVRYFAVRYPYVDENKLCVSYLQQSLQKSTLNVSFSQT